MLGEDDDGEATPPEREFASVSGGVPHLRVEGGWCRRMLGISGLQLTSPSLRQVGSKFSPAPSAWARRTRLPWQVPPPSPQRSSVGTCGVVRHRDGRFFQTIPLQEQSPTNCLSSTFSCLSACTFCCVASRTASRVNRSFPASMNSFVHA